MHPAGVGFGGGNGESRGGNLHRYRSAPANWLEALLESELENDVVLDPPQPPVLSSSKPPQPPSAPLARYPSADLLDAAATAGAGGLSGFLRQNSSPPEFLSQINSDGYFSSFGIPANYDYLMQSSLEISTNKRPGDVHSETTPPPKKGEHGAQFQGGMGGLLDAEMEKLSEDAVLCRVRAKRGCATHPRSIAERVRRTRISDRIRKLQELVPNMDKQTNTADMLEEAAEYVKLLQRQIQELTEHQKRCKCLIKE